MGKILRAQSTLTDRYQTTIPEAIRESLHLGKRDKITYTIEKNGKVLLTRASENDPLIGQFLSFLAADMTKHPQHIKAISPQLRDRVKDLVSGVEVDLDAPLDNQDE